MSPKRDADDPRIGAPSPADNPTTPHRPVAPAGAGVGSREPATVTDRPTEPAHPTEPRPAPADGAAASASRARVTPGHTAAGGTWVGVILGAVLLIFLLVFVLQNLQPARVSFLGLNGTLPLGVWLLFAAIAGVLLLAVPGLGRLVQWRRAGKATRGGSRSGSRGGRGRR